MEVVRLELPGLLKAFPIVDGQLAGPEGDQPLGSERLKHAVDMHGRKTQRVAKVFLRQGQPQAAVRRKADGLEAHEKLAKEMRDPPVSRAPAQADHPLAKDCAVDQRVLPERLGDSWVVADQVPERRMREDG